MTDDVRDITEFYDSNPDAEHGCLELHQLEHDLTLRYLRAYLPPEGAILEVGAATGKYTLALARRGYRVTAVDLSAALIERCRQNLIGEGLESRARLVVADARDLGEVEERQFDAVLLIRRQWPCRRSSARPHAAAGRRASAPPLSAGLA